MNFETWNNVLTLVFSAVTVGLGIAVFYLALWDRERDKEYKEIQKKIAKLELMNLTNKADVIVYLEDKQVPVYVKMDSQGEDSAQIGTKIAKYIIVKNVGNAEARNVKIEVVGVDQHPEIEINRVDEWHMIGVLAQGTEIKYRFNKEKNIGNNFFGKWSWENPNGGSESRESDFRL